MYEAVMFRDGSNFFLYISYDIDFDSPGGCILNYIWHTVTHSMSLSQITPVELLSLCEQHLKIRYSS